MASQKEVADHIDLTTRQVRTLLKSGVLPSGSGAGGLNIDNCRLAYIRYLRGRATGKVDAKHEIHDQHKERARLTHHQANIASLEEGRIRGDLLSADEVSDAWEGVITSFRAKILALPIKLAAEIHAENKAAVQSAAERHVYDALSELSAYEIPEIKPGDTDSETAA